MDEEPRYEPEKIEAASDTGLRITWADGHVSAWDLPYIRLRCSCAHCNELRRVGEPAWPRPGGPEELDVVDAELVGSYGITFFWSDGHQAGVYRWDDLREGCPCAECSTARRSEGRANPLDRRI